jgi:hypothetical protein
MKEKIELKDLVGEHYLSGFDRSVEKVELWENMYEEADAVKFVIDGLTYKAIEDPCDQLRSMLREIEVTDEKVTNSFPPQKVIAKMKDDGEWSGETHNTIQFIDVVTEKVVLEVGTDNTDDYYPYCVLHWYPENLAINVGRWS